MFRSIKYFLVFLIHFLFMELKHVSISDSVALALSSRRENKYLKNSTSYSTLPGVFNREFGLFIIKAYFYSVI